MSEIIAILNQKGGVGKTTTVINAGAYLAKSGKSVLVIDFDPQANATSGLGIDKQGLETTVYDAMFDKEVNINSVIQKTTTSSLNILPANTELANAEVDLVDKKNREFYLSKILEPLQYDFILIDCPPSLGLLTINALSAAEWLLIPVQAEYYALEGLSQLLDVTQRVKRVLNKDLEILGVVVTMYDSRTSLAEQVHKELISYFEDKVFKTLIPRNVRLAEAPSYGRPIAEHDKWSKGARAYKQLTKEIIRKIG
jgi:chromosome partitioning protein